MNQEELKKYIRKKLRSGYPAGELKNELQAKGITLEEINQVMNQPKRSWSTFSTRKNMLILNLACVLLLLLSGFFFIISAPVMFRVGAVALVFLVAIALWLPARKNS